MAVVLLYVAVDNQVIDYVIMSMSLALSISIVVSYFRSTMMYDDNYTNTPYDYTEHIEYECTGAHVYEDLEQRMIMFTYNTQEDEDTLPY